MSWQSRVRIKQVRTPFPKFDATVVSYCGRCWCHLFSLMTHAEENTCAVKSCTCDQSSPGGEVQSGLPRGEERLSVGQEGCVLLVIYFFWLTHVFRVGFPGGSDHKESTYHARDPSSIPGLGRSPGEGNGYPHQYSCLENPMDREALWAIVHGVAKSLTGLNN